jgi:DNA-binding transcriptional LysR family regulator
MFIIHAMNVLARPLMDPLLKTLDLNLLRVAAALREAGSVTAAARRLGITQAAASNALARLRRACGDPLFIRTPLGMSATPHGERIADAAVAALASVAASIAAPPGFDPAADARLFTLRMTDIGEWVFLPGLLRCLAERAPRTTLRTVALSSGDTPAALARGEVDLAIGFLPELREGWYQQRLFEQRYVTLRRAGSAGNLGRAAFLRAGHVAIESAGTGHRIVEQALRAQGVSRRIVLQVPDFLAAVVIVSRSDLICTVPLKLAQAAAESLPVQSGPVPFDLPGFAIHQYWHPRVHRDAAVQWLRERVAERFAEPPAACGRQHS